ncbi:formylglycine-generating enzyme family protein [Flavobacterium circumlabens]|uniref:Formylglycine-generating enzyme family protein n=1 Tax=Flavobacterium circumlabens TaxID=2133765 RepID=A0A4Y7UCT6_9FLAO|nr:formylglycine-generating enzyme family protein [Flavobacterium circumlabens]TCN57506.1 formylglycine-generating enzyme required for sulfatase activity [Flavobacterium circumlabens]TEB43818.1 formylglycine-generating enzyme family protein [Flavobacterium circumlabens]
MKNKIYWIFAILTITTISIAYGFTKFIVPKEKSAAMDCTEATASKASSEFEPTIVNKNSAPAKAPKGMVWIPGGEFSMGSNVEDESLCSIKGITKDAAPIHRVYVDGYFMDETEVTNEQFAKFVNATGYVTVAEQKPTQEEFPDAPPENLIAGSVIFSPTPAAVNLNDFLQWWSYVGGTDWKHPLGPESSIKGKEKYPAVQITYEDAAAYAKWAGKRLPTEAEWEFAARGGKTGNLYAWGNTLKPNGKFQANIYQGHFPIKDGDTGEDGFKGIAPTAQFKPNAYGLYDMAGNVWEWVNDWYSPSYYSELNKDGKTAKNPQGPDSYNDPNDPTEKKRVHRGGSFLCTDQYCTRYMVGTRGKGEIRSAANHLGFRCVKSI